MKITITEALVKLKTIESRIEKAVSKLQVVTAKKNSETRVINGVTDEKDFINRAKSDYQSVTDLIKLRSDMKAAITQSNAQTKVLIAGKEYTVAEAIDKKNSISLEENLLNTLKREFKTAINSVSALNKDAEYKADKNVETILGNDKAKNKTEESQSLYNTVYESNKGVLVDPLNVENLINTKENEVKDFLDSVDTQLVISNSTTFIEV